MNWISLQVLQNKKYTTLESARQRILYIILKINEFRVCCDFMMGWGSEWKWEWVDRFEEEKWDIWGESRQSRCIIW